MILPMAIDANRSPAMLVRIVKELDPSLEHKSDQCVRSRPAIAVIHGQRLAEHMLDQVQFFVFLKNPAPVLPGGRVPAPDRCKGEHRFGRDQPIRIFRDHGLKFAQEQQRQLDRDAA